MAWAAFSSPLSTSLGVGMWWPAERRLQDFHAVERPEVKHNVGHALSKGQVGRGLKRVQGLITLISNQMITKKNSRKKPSQQYYTIPNIYDTSQLHTFHFNSTLFARTWGEELTDAIHSTKNISKIRTFFTPKVNLSQQTAPPTVWSDPIESCELPQSH